MSSKLLFQDVKENIERIHVLQSSMYLVTASLISEKSNAERVTVPLVYNWNWKPFCCWLLLHFGPVPVHRRPEMLHDMRAHRKPETCWSLVTDKRHRRSNWTGPWARGRIILELDGSKWTPSRLDDAYAKGGDARSLHLSEIIRCVYLVLSGRVFVPRVFPVDGDLCFLESNTCVCPLTWGEWQKNIRESKSSTENVDKQKSVWRG